VGSTTEQQAASYDTFGNILSLSSTDYGSRGFTMIPGLNRISGVTYDASGNQLGWGTDFTYYYYPTNQIRDYRDSSNSRRTVFGFTVDGERVGVFDSTLGITYTLRGLDGKVLREYLESGGTWTWKKDYVYRDGQHLAVIDSAGTRHFHLDHLGTIRRITNSSGSLAYSHDYYPFGQEATNAYADMERMKYTGHERDLRDTTKTNDDLDYMHARHYNPNLARFLSVDPGRDNTPDAPQSWNLYSYVRNNPVTQMDPDGRAAADAACKLEFVTESFVSLVDASTSGGPLGIAALALAGTIADLVRGTTDLLKVGEATGYAIGSGAGNEDILAGVARDAGRAGGLLLAMASPASSAMRSVNAASAAEVRVATGATSAPSRIKSAQVMRRAANEPGLYHNFPGSLDSAIYEGRRAVVSPGYAQYTRPGTVNGVSGVYEIGVRVSPSGRIEIVTHRFFRPDV